MHRRLAAAVTLSVTLLLGACTDDAPKPPPPQSPAPTMPSESPTSPSQTPTPSPSVNQEAADKAAVEKVYRIQFAEYNRLEMAGGSTKLTQVLLDTTSGQHQAHYLMWLKEDKANGQRQVGRGKLVGVVAGSGNSRHRNVTACEDYTGVKWTRHGKPVKPQGSLRNVQHASAVKGMDGKWRIDLVGTEHVKDFKNAICGRNR